MVRKTKTRHKTKPAKRKLFKNSKQKAELEERNGLFQFDEVIGLINAFIKSRKKYKLRPSTIQSLHRIAIKDIFTCAGNYRNEDNDVIIEGSDHEPPDWLLVPGFVEDMCEYVNKGRKTPIHYSAYVMWRLNWIHPFAGGNGRTTRAVSHLVLCTKLGYIVPGTPSIPEQIVADRDPYYDALTIADNGWKKGKIDVKRFEKLLSDMLAKQLVSIISDATGDKSLIN